MKNDPWLNLTPSGKDKWALITTYKVLDPTDINFQFMETFINFYRKKWNVTKEILLVGIPEELAPPHKREPILQIESRIAGPLVADTVSGAATFSEPTHIQVKPSPDSSIDAFFGNIQYYSSPKTDVVLYTTNYSTSNAEWDIIKNTLFQICNKMLDPSYNRVINIDNDEFLFLDSERAPQVEEWFHFFEHAAFPTGTSFDSKQDFLWCLQPWYCRVLSGAAAHRPPENNPSAIMHNGCKKYRFAREDLSPFPNWVHRTDGPSSAACNLMDLASANNLDLGGLIPHINRCYHLGVLDEDHYVFGKAIQYSATQTSLDSREAELQELREHYANYYSRDAINAILKSDPRKFRRLDIVVDNSLQEYWVND